MNKLRKILLVILCACMILSFVPTAVLAASDETGINTGDTVNLKSVTQGVSAVANVAGVGGKAEDDVVIRYDVPAGINGGFGNDYIAINPIKQGEDFYAEFSVMMPDGEVKAGNAGELRVGFNYFTTQEKSDSQRADYNLISIKSDYVRVQTATGSEILAIEGGRWYTFGMYVPKTGGNATVYINGVSYSVLLPEAFYGVRAGRAFPRNKDNTEAFSFYMDNIRDYSVAKSTVYDPDWDKAAELIFKDGTEAVSSDGRIECFDGTSVSDLKEKLTAYGANIRIYNKELTHQLSDSDTVSDESVVVLGSENGFLCERVYSYYNIKTVLVDETGINTGDTVNLRSPTQGVTSTVNIAGVSGKRADDFVIRYDVPAGINGGFGNDYIALSPTKQGEDNYFAEFSVMMPDGEVKAGNAGELRVGINYFSKEDLSANSNCSLLSIKGDCVRVQDSVGSEILAIEGGKWYTFAIYVSKSGGAATVYINGKSYSVLLPESFYGIRDTRLFARNKDNTEAFSFYMDNMRGYSSSSKITYNPKWDKTVVLSSADELVTIDENNIISCPDAIGAGELKEKLNALDANIRIYNATITEELSDSDIVPANAMLVAALKNGFSFERTYSYFKVKKLNGSESETDESKISVTVVNGSASIKVNGEDKGEAPLVSEYPVGSSLTYMALPADENKVFLYWQDADSNIILSEEETVEVIVGTDAAYKAIFADTENEIYVVFKSNTKVLQAGTKESVTIPPDPYMVGYVFKGWYDEEGKLTDVTLEVNENTVYTAGFTLDKTEYTVEVVGANEDGGVYQYNEKVTVTAACEEGKVFAYWSRDNKIVSYSESYTFYVSSDTQVVANYAASAVEKQIVLVMAKPVLVGENLDKIAFYAERSVPEEYTVIENGILLSQEESFDLNTTGVIKAKAKNTSNNGQYTIRKANVKPGDTWRAKAYIIYSDGENNYTVYSDIVSMTVQ